MTTTTTTTAPKGTARGEPREVAALSTVGQYDALLVTVTVHLHSDLLNNAGIILVEGKRKRRTYLEPPRPSTREASADVSTRVYLPSNGLSNGF